MMRFEKEIYQKNCKIYLEKQGKKENGSSRRVIKQ